MFRIFTITSIDCILARSSRTLPNLVLNALRTAGERSNHSVLLLCRRPLTASPVTMASTTGPDATTPSPSPVTAPTPPAKRSAAESPAPNSLKRKRGETKYYAVKAGFRPGIYANWNDCLKQISGYKNAVCSWFHTLIRGAWTDDETVRSFTSAEEARSFLTGEKSFSTTANSQEPTRFYGVQHGHVPGVYTNWAEAQAQIKNFSRPRYKKFSTRKEAEEFVRLGQKQSATPRPAPGMTHEPPRDEEGAELPADQAPLPSGAEDGFDPNVRLDPISGKIVYKKPEQKAATKLQPTATPGMLRIYTDGSSLKNGSKAAQAGVGVYFGPGDQRYERDYVTLVFCVQHL